QVKKAFQELSLDLDDFQGYDAAGEGEHSQERDDDDHVSEFHDMMGLLRGRLIKCFLERMENYGVFPDERTHNTILLSLPPDAAKRYFRRKIHEPNERNYNHLLLSIVENDDHQRQGRRSSEVDLISVKTRSRGLVLAEVETLLEEMKEKQFRPSLAA
ncbi:unnamed protein product, partial [Amoebophrya sp. A120]